MAEEPRQSSRAYGPFAAAATFYVAGVLLLTGWLYAKHRTSLVEQHDLALRSAVQAVREFVGTGRARGHILEGVTNAPVYLQHTERFNRYAKVSGLDLLAMARHEADRTWLLMASDKSRYPNGKPAGGHGSPLPENLDAETRDLSAERIPGVRLLHGIGPPSKAMRLAVLYAPEDADTGFFYLAGEDTGDLNTELQALLLRKVGTAVFLLGMMIPLVVLYNRARRKSTEKLAEFNTRLQQDVDKQKSREEELKEAIHDLERFNQVAAGREMRILELKSEVNELLVQLDRNERYNIDRID